MKVFALTCAALIIIVSSAWAQCGWLLMLPPHDIVDLVIGDKRRREPVIRTDAPLKQWTHEASFDTAKECEAAKAKGKPYPGGYPTLTQHQLKWENARCIPGMGR